MINKKRGITLIALVITIIIMLLLAAVAIQMSFGENGLIVKANQAKLEQEKSGLLELLKIEYLNLKAKAIKDEQTVPDVEATLSTPKFLESYNIIGSNIVDKKGNVIENKEDVIKKLKNEYNDLGSKVISGVTIKPEDKDKMIIKLIVKDRKANLRFCRYVAESYGPLKPLTIDFGTGEISDQINFYYGELREYEVGEYILKMTNTSFFSIEAPDNIELEILQWGIIDRNEDHYGPYTIELPYVKKIYEPEPDNVPITYVNAIFKEIPKDLFSKKKKCKESSIFWGCRNITEIPENLYDNCLGLESMERAFLGCAGLKHIPTKIINKAISLSNNSQAFKECINADNYNSLPSYLKE
jgi:hypothetical protein